jgi:hypothetical protein
MRSDALDRCCATVVRNAMARNRSRIDHPQTSKAGHNANTSFVRDHLHIAGYAWVELAIGLTGVCAPEPALRVRRLEGWFACGVGDRLWLQCVGGSPATSCPWRATLARPANRACAHGALRLPPRCRDRRHSITTLDSRRSDEPDHCSLAHMPVMLSRGFAHGVDLVGGGVVLVDDGAVSDACVDEGHAHGFVAEHRGDGFEAHASVDGLGGEDVAELVVGERDRCRPGPRLGLRFHLYSLTPLVANYPHASATSHAQANMIQGPSTHQQPVVSFRYKKPFRNHEKHRYARVQHEES